MIKSLIKTGKLTLILVVTLIITTLIASCLGKIEPKTKWQYIAGSNEIPLFNGLEIIKDETTNFDSPSGNISFSSYKGYVQLTKVENFYNQALNQLGWKLISKKDNNFFYQRSNDKLEINFKKQSNGLLYVNFLTSSNSSE